MHSRSDTGAAFCCPDFRTRGGMNMILKLNPKQSAKVRRLARSKCCNCVDGNCLLLDDGEECKCVQLISRYGIYCNYFRKAVLPAEKKLYEEILQQNKIR